MARPEGQTSNSLLRTLTVCVFRSDHPRYSSRIGSPDDRYHRDRQESQGAALNWMDMDGQMEVPVPSYKWMELEVTDLL